MLLESQETIEEQILKAVAEMPLCSATESHAVLERRGSSVSKQAIYHHLKSLEAGSVITKIKTRYRVNIGWVLNLHAFSQSLVTTHLQPEVLYPQIGGTERTVWNFKTLGDLHDFFFHVMLCFSLMKETTNHINLWFQHPWFVIAHRTGKPLLLEAIRRTGKQFHFVLGPPTFLTEACILDWPHDIYHPTYLEQSPPEDYQSMSWALFNDVVVIIEMSLKLTHLIDQIFREASTIHEASLASTTLRLFEDPHKLRLIIDPRETSVESKRALIREWMRGSGEGTIERLLLNLSKYTFNFGRKLKVWFQG
jgi:hypothetical protein